MNYLIIMIIFVAFSLLGAMARGESTGCLPDVLFIIAVVILLVVIIGIIIVSDHARFPRITFFALYGVFMLVLNYFVKKLK